MVAAVEEIGVVEMFGDKIVVNLKIVPSIPMAIGFLMEVVVSIVTKGRHYTKGEADMAFSYLDKQNTAFFNTAIMD